MVLTAYLRVFPNSYTKTEQLDSKTKNPQNVFYNKISTNPKTNGGVTKHQHTTCTLLVSVKEKAEGGNRANDRPEKKREEPQRGHHIDERRRQANCRKRLELQGVLPCPHMVGEQNRPTDL